jgi:hypothetical protein
VIFAGYKHDMDVNILRSNEGFRRRIQWFFHVDDYSPDELYQIFLQKIKDTHFDLQPSTRFDVGWFREHAQFFPYFGGSVENWVHKIRTVHTRKTFGFSEKTLLPDETVEEGFRMYLQFTLEPIRPPVLPSIPFGLLQGMLPFPPPSFSTMTSTAAMDAEDQDDHVAD